MIALLAGNTDLELEATLLHDVLLPAFDAPDLNSEDAQQLVDYANSAQYAPPECDADALPLNGQYIGKNGEKLAFSQLGADLLVTLPHNGCFGAGIVRCGRGAYRESTIHEVHLRGYRSSQRLCYAAYGWCGKMLEVDIRIPEAAVWRHDRFTFDETGVAQILSGVGLEGEAFHYQSVTHA